jgi:REP-associated tyrosine transposase
MTAEPQSEELRPERLRRLDRIFQAFPIYFVTACAFDRRPILADPAIHQSFMDFAAAGEGHGAYIGAHVIMPDHLHLFVALEPDKRLSVSVKSLKNSLSKTLRSLEVPSRHWQKGFFDHVLRSAESYSQKWEYVCENPVRAGLVRNWEEWPYCGEIWPIEYRE